MLYDRIKDLCKEREITIAALERELGFPRSSLSKVDKHTPSMQKMQKIADYFGITVDELSDGNPDLEERRQFTRNMTHFFNQIADQMAQELFDDPNLRLLFDAAEGSRPEDIKMAADLLTRLKEARRDV